ncbi:hypothetical protein ACKWTF_006341 [Chironomus riparius]
MFSEEIYNSLHNTNLTIEKDRNNNSTISTKGKPKIDKQTNNKNESYETVVVAAPIASSKEKKNVKIADTKSSFVSESSGTNTLKRKRETKSPVKCADSQLEQESSKKQQSGSSQTTTATILVSKTKTKSGLPMLLKK